MAKREVEPVDNDLVGLVSGIVTDAGTLVGQQIELAKADIGRELRRAAEGGASVALGGGLLAAGGVLAGLSAVHLLNRITGLSLWACYATAAGGLGAAGLRYVRAGRDEVAGVHLIPPPATAAAIRENVAWLTDQTTPGGR